MAQLSTRPRSPAVEFPLLDNGDCMSFATGYMFDFDIFEVDNESRRGLVRAAIFVFGHLDGVRMA